MYIKVTMIEKVFQDFQYNCKSMLGGGRVSARIWWSLCCNNNICGTFHCACFPPTHTHQVPLLKNYEGSLIQHCELLCWKQREGETSCKFAVSGCKDHSQWLQSWIILQKQFSVNSLLHIMVMSEDCGTIPDTTSKNTLWWAPFDRKSHI